LIAQKSIIYDAKQLFMPPRSLLTAPWVLPPAIPRPEIGSKTRVDVEGDDPPRFAMLAGPSVLMATTIDCRP
jgi:hypothetical protein